MEGMASENLNIYSLRTRTQQQLSEDQGNGLMKYMATHSKGVSIRHKGYQEAHANWHEVPC